MMSFCLLLGLHAADDDNKIEAASITTKIAQIIEPLRPLSRIGQIFKSNEDKGVRYVRERPAYSMHLSNNEWEVTYPLLKAGRRTLSSSPTFVSNGIIYYPMRMSTRNALTSRDRRPFINSYDYAYESEPYYIASYGENANYLISSRPQIRTSEPRSFARRTSPISRLSNGYTRRHAYNGPFSGHGYEVVGYLPRRSP